MQKCKSLCILVEVNKGEVMKEWLTKVRGILIEMGYGKDFTLCPKSWGQLREQGMHPVKAVSVMEDIDLLKCAICYEWSKD